MDLFLAGPDNYIAGELPALPRLLSGEHIQVEGLELKGYCAVTLFEGPEGFGSIIQGDKTISAFYLDKTYVFASQEKVDQFMKTPWKYVDQVLPNELPPIRVAVPLKNLPIVGYLEETLSVRINAALAELGKFKPKYPYKSLDDSARIFLALWLKGNNPSAKEWLQKSYRGKLEKFKDDCEIIGELAGYMEQRIYMAPGDRELGFEPKMEYFLSLKKGGLKI